MPKYIENETQIEVDVTGLRAWDGEPQMDTVTYPDGTTQYTMRHERMVELFTIVSPQTIQLRGLCTSQYDRPLPAQQTGATKP